MMEPTIARAVYTHNPRTPVTALKEWNLAYHAQQLPDRITRLRPNTEPVLCARAVESYLLVWASIGILIVQVRGTFRDGVVGADDFEGLGATGGAVQTRVNC